MNNNHLKVQKGQSIYFDGELLPFKVKAIDTRYAICTRELSREADDEILEFEVDRGAYSSKDIAFKKLKDAPVYTIIDFDANKRGTHNLILNPYDFRNQESIDELMDALNTGDAELSRRTSIDLRVDWILTLNL